MFNFCAMARPRHRPQRTCIACRTTQDKRGLIRIVRTPEGDIVLDPTGKANGRGAYLCHQPACWENGLKKKLLSNALKAIIPTEQLEILLAQLESEFSKV